MRLIDADALRIVFTEKSSERVCGVELCKAIIFRIDEAPTIDAVPVVRCKDCKWYYRGGATCMFWDGANGMCGDDFCGKAERAEE